MQSDQLQLAIREAKELLARTEAVLLDSSERLKSQKPKIKPPAARD
jgi:hypothetical protein